MAGSDGRTEEMPRKIRTLRPWAAESASVSWSTGAMGAAKRGPLALLERIALAAASMLVSINVCTGFPLAALWIGSLAANGNVFSWVGIITAIVSLAVLAALGVTALARLSARYDKLSGRPPAPRHPPPREPRT